MFCILGALVVGYVADLFLGDPHGIWHPICFIGNMISVFEKGLRRIFPKTKHGELLAGVFLVIFVLFCAAAIPAVLLYICFRVHWILGFAVECYMCCTILATKSLKTESMKVYTALEKEGVEEGRRAVSMIVGRDTHNLTETGVVKAAVETIAENTSDGIIAPMIFMVIGGPVLGYFYKAVNTMDSMVGYKNEKYLYFGRAAAKFDDVMNYLPSRISAWMMIAAAPLAGLDAKEGRRIFKRDRRKHASPNAAQTEAVMAGALHVQLVGPAWYFGEKYDKPTIGDDTRPVERDDIVRANRLLYMSSAVSMIVFCAVRIFIDYIVIWGMSFGFPV